MMPSPTTVTMAPAIMRCLPDRSTTAEPPRCEMARRAHLSPTRGPSPDARPARTLSYAGVVSIAPPARPLRYHFSGIAGAGMNPLARLMRARGHTVQGSDRALDQGKSGDLAEAARALGIERVARPALLAEVVNAGRPGVAIAGTSGKSTITGMVTWLTREARLPATALGGAALVGEGVSGCFLAGPDAAPVAAEACESDGTLTGYAPALGVIHNISRDHGEVDALRPQFEAFARSARRLLVNAACPEAFAVGRAVGASSYGPTRDAEARLEILSVGPDRARGVLHAPAGPVALDIPQPGAHNLENAAAAALVALTLGLAPDAIADALARFPGVARRFE